MKYIGHLVSVIFFLRHSVVVCSSENINPLQNSEKHEITSRPNQCGSQLLIDCQGNHYKTGKYQIDRFSQATPATFILKPKVEFSNKMEVLSLI